MWWIALANLTRFKLVSVSCGEDKANLWVVNSPNTWCTYYTRFGYTQIVVIIEIKMNVIWVVKFSLSLQLFCMNEKNW